MNNINNLQEIRKKAVERVAIDSLNYLDHCDMVYVSFDVDSMDSRISSGTGTPVPNGITEKEAGNLIYYIMRSKKICCFEIRIRIVCKTKHFCSFIYSQFCF